MCSGCSGQFEDGEDRERGDGDPVEGDGEGVRRSAGDGRGSCEEPLGRAQEPADGADDYEVWVSAERIVERRTIRAKSFVVSGEGAVEPAKKWDEGLRRRERSQWPSARDYRTLMPFNSQRGDGDGTTRKCLRWACLGAVTLAGLALWLAAR
jgi:hypothetical protein